MSNFQRIAFSTTLAWVICLLITTQFTHAQDVIGFVDRPIALKFAGLDNQSFKGSVSVLTRAGWSASQQQSLQADHHGDVFFTPCTEGLHAITTAIDGKAVTVKMLAVTAPSKVSDDAILKALPHHGNELLAGKPITIVAMGDSVTATGIYHKLLVMMLREATGNDQITLHVKAHPGKSVDATVRTFDTDIRPLMPDIGLLMYGLNDQGVGGAMDVYLKQTQWICEQLQSAFKTDMILLQPTPHIENEQTAFRTVAYAQALRHLGENLSLPVVPTFDAIWGDGGSTLSQSMQRLWPLYPPHYRKTWQSLLDTQGKGDTIHPNILGHLKMAKALFKTLTGQPDQLKALQIKAKNAWTDTGMVTQLQVTNTTNSHRSGDLDVFSAGDFDQPLASRLAYDLRPQASEKWTIHWPAIKYPTDLLQLPASSFITHEQPFLAITDHANNQLSVQAVQTQRAGSLHYPPQRIVTDSNTFHIQMRDGHSRVIQSMDLPENQQVGVMPLVTSHQNQTATARLSFTQFAQAIIGKANIDGQLDEWQEHTFSPLGQPSQACWVRGPTDFRDSIEACNPSFAFKSDDDGLYMAIKVTGLVDSDQLTVFFDPRPAEELGQPGGYYWINAGFKNGRFTATRGETSPRVRIASAMKRDGDLTTIEMFIPYATFKQTRWPTSQDMGLSLWWRHKDEQGSTHLQWSDRGHPWNAMHYGVLRRVSSPNETLPYLVQIWP